MPDEKQTSDSKEQEKSQQPTVLDKFDGDPVAFLKSYEKAGTSLQAAEKKKPEIKIIKPEPEEPEEEAVSGRENISLQSINPENKEPEKTYSKTELEARRKGWISKDEYRGNADDWMPAGQYLKNWSFINQLKTQDSSIKSLSKQIEDLVKLQQTQSKIFVEKHAEEVKKKADEAFKEGNLEEFRKYDREYQSYTAPIEKFHEKQQTVQQDIPQNAQIPAEVIDFQRRNSWFNNNSPMDAAMTVYAKQLDQQIMQQYPALPISERLKEVETAVKNEFSAFHNNARDEYSPVESKGGRQYSKSEQTIEFDYLPDNIKRIVTSVVENSKGKITKEQCIKNFRKKGLIKVE